MPDAVNRESLPRMGPAGHDATSRLAERSTVVAIDLRGYGDSGKPGGERDHACCSGREALLEAPRPFLLA